MASTNTSSTASSHSFSVRGKTALITGAGSGINLFFARLLLTLHCNVAIADLTLRPEAQLLLDQHSTTTTSSSGKARAIFVRTDVTLWSDLTHMFDIAEREFGSIDIVCPGAGIYEPHWSNFWYPPGSPPSVDQVNGSKVEGWGHYTTLDVNVVHPIRTTQIAVSRWLNPRPGSGVEKVSPQNPKRVVHISSIAGQISGLNTPLYTASKHAISGFIRSMATLEQEIGVRVNGVAPGLTKTPLFTEHPEKLQAVDEARDEWVRPEEVAGVMLQCVEGEEWGGGAVVEVLKGRTRRVGERMDPGPVGAGASVSNRGVITEEVREQLRTEGWGVVKGST